MTKKLRQILEQQKSQLLQKNLNKPDKIYKSNEPHYQSGLKHGREALKAGKQEIPASDSNARNYSKNLTPDTKGLKSYNDYLSGWLSGYHRNPLPPKFVPEQ